MKSNYSQMAKHLESLFVQLNAMFYCGMLPDTVITIASDQKKGAYGWCSSERIWSDTDGNNRMYEINICAEYLQRPYEDIAATLLHEMAHLYNTENGIEDTSRGGYYHNRRFAETAQAHGLVMGGKSDKYGFSETFLSDEAREFVNDLIHVDFDMARQSQKTEGKTGRKQSYIRYVCPQCGAIVRSTKPLNIICGDCNVLFEGGKTL